MRHLLFETDPLCRAVLTAKLESDDIFLSQDTDSNGLLGSVLALTDNDCALMLSLLDKHPNLSSVLFVGGSPCQGLSRANPRRKHLKDPRSVLVWVFAVLVARARAHATATLKKFSVHFLVENVVMDSLAEARITKMLATPAQHIDAALWSPTSRPRTY